MRFVTTPARRLARCALATVVLAAFSFEGAGAARVTDALNRDDTLWSGTEPSRDAIASQTLTENIPSTKHLLPQGIMELGQRNASASQHNEDAGVDASEHQPFTDNLTHTQHWILPPLLKDGFVEDVAEKKTSMDGESLPGILVHRSWLLVLVRILASILCLGWLVTLVSLLRGYTFRRPTAKHACDIGPLDGLNVDILGCLEPWPATDPESIIAPVAKVPCCSYELQVVVDIAAPSLMVRVGFAAISFKEIFVHLIRILLFSLGVRTSSFQTLVMAIGANWSNEKVLLTLAEGAEYVALRVDDARVLMNLKSLGHVDVPWRYYTPLEFAAADPVFASRMLEEVHAKHGPEIIAGKVFIRERHLEFSLLVWCRGDLICLCPEDDGSTIFKLNGSGASCYPRVWRA
mmetsp:Transcript_99676/g.281368  ORF Transcript_99676/g.281368 Transcript_99676/m.281368 type:complete len:405 (+) Transcript_99676:79-1293(+)